MNKRFTKVVALTMASLSLANLAAFASAEEIKEQEPTTEIIEKMTFEEECELLNRFGDINIDGEVTNADLLVCAKAVIGSEKLKGYNYIIADINKDGIITNNDLVILSRHLVGLDYALNYDSIKKENDAMGSLDALFRDPEKSGEDYAPGEVVVYITPDVYINTSHEKISPEQLKDLFPNIEIDHIVTRTPVGGLTVFYLKENTKEAVVDAIHKLVYSPYAWQAYA